MKITKDADFAKLQAKLENLELPEVQMPAYQQRLRETLLASACFEKEVAPLPFQQKIKARIYNIKPVAWKLVASLALLFLILGTYRTFFTASQAVASLSVQVNPAITMTISARNKVIAAEGLDVQGQTLLAGLDLTGQEVREALRIIAGALREAGLLSPERRIIIELHPVGGRLGEADLAALSGNVRRTVDEYLAEHGLTPKVVSSELTADFTEAAAAAGLLPADYVDLVATVGYPLARQLLDLYKELGLSPARFREELAGITEAMTELIEEEGLSEKEALARIKKAIKADPLKGFDDFPEAPEKETDEEESDEPARPESDPDAPEKDSDERDEPDRPERDKSKPGAPGDEKDEAGGPSDYEPQEPPDSSQEE